MDTLSRKHRLRQQQQQQYLAKENQQHQISGSADYYFDQFQSSGVAKGNYNLNQNAILSNNNNNNNTSEDEEEQFQVFSLSALGEQQFEGILNGPPVSSSSTSGSSLKCRKLNPIDRRPHQIECRDELVSDELELYEQVEGEEDEDDQDDQDDQDDDDDDDDDDDENVDEEALSSSIMHYIPERNSAHNNRRQAPSVGSYYADCSTGSCSTNTTFTLKSTGGHSSGFLSAEESLSQVEAHKHRRHRDRHHSNNHNHNSNGAGNNRQQEKPRRNRNNHHHNHLHEKQKRDRLSARSQVIDDLDRLMADVDRRRTSNSNSPADSCLSCYDSTSLMHTPICNHDRHAKAANGNELDYSTLCRDEFSSFIAHPSNGHKLEQTGATDCRETRPPASRLELRSGPTLIGIHDTNINNNNSSNNQNNNNNNAPPPHQATTHHRSGPAKGSHFVEGQHMFNIHSSRDSSSPNRSDLSESQHEFRSSPSTSSELSTTATSGSNSVSGNLMRRKQQESLISVSDGEFVVIDDGSASEQLHRHRDDHANLSQMLDVYLNRVHCLIRLTSGDKSVSMEEAFDDEGDGILCVSEENCTDVVFSLFKRESSSTKVIQEMIVTEQEDDEELSNDNCQLITNSIGNCEYASLLSSMQTSARLNWLLSPDDQLSFDGDAQVRGKQLNEKNLEKSREKLAESLVKSLLKVSGNSDFLTNNSRAREAKTSAKLIETIRQHVNEFIESYDIYQAELKTQTSFASDWHQNWLFAYKRPQDHYEGESSCFSGPKRARMSTGGSDGGQPQQPIDMFKYSTLILSKCKPIKLTYLSPNMSGFDIEHFYEAQQDQFSELCSQAIDSGGRADVTRMLLSDLFDGFHEPGSNSKSSSPSNCRPLLINYDSSLKQPATCTNRFSFSAYGYRFETPIIKFANRCDGLKLARLRERILIKVEELLKSTNTLNDSQSIRNNNNNNLILSQSDQVRFLINLTNVELINKLPVIQFCAKVSGAPPISVRWFKEDIEISDMPSLRQQGKLHHARVRAGHFGLPKQTKQSYHSSPPTSSSSTSNWPIEMSATYDYEYKNECSSWYRFRRQQDEIVFEIRDANLELDYNQTYRCVITNYCSRDECSFSLKQRQVEERKYIVAQGSRNSMVAELDGKDCNHRRRSDGHALLRTWSQRTLHKPVPQEQQVPSSAALDLLQVDNKQSEASRRDLSLQQSIGRRSLAGSSDEKPFEEDKFGKNFPYHPENLLKRLEENKFSTLLKCRRLVAPATAAAAATTVDQNSSRNFSAKPTPTTCSLDAPLDLPETQFANSFEPIMETLPEATAARSPTILVQHRETSLANCTGAKAAKRPESFQVQQATGRDMTGEPKVKATSEEQHRAQQKQQPMPRLSRQLAGQSTVSDGSETVAADNKASNDKQQVSSSSRLIAQPTRGGRSIEVQRQLPAKLTLEDSKFDGPPDAQQAIESGQVRATYDDKQIVEGAVGSFMSTKGVSARWSRVADDKSASRNMSSDNNGLKVNVKSLISRFSLD